MLADLKTAPCILGMAKFNSRAAEKLFVLRILEFSRNCFGIWELLLNESCFCFFVYIEMGNYTLCYADFVLKVAFGNALEVAIH